MTKVKICGVKSPHIVEMCAEAGADYIGFVFAETSLRYITVAEAKDMVKIAMRSGVEPVAVFNNPSQDQIIDIVQRTGIRIIQVHGAIPDVPQYLSCIYTSVYPYKMPSSLREAEDYILFDNTTPGSGELLCIDDLPLPVNCRTFLAGGLNLSNVNKAISTVRPYAVDISSGVESSPGVKSRSMIQSLISTVKEHHYG